MKYDPFCFQRIKVGKLIVLYLSRLDHKNVPVLRDIRPCRLPPGAGRRFPYFFKTVLQRRPAKPDTSLYLQHRKFFLHSTRLCPPLALSTATLCLLQPLALILSLPSSDFNVTYQLLALDIIYLVDVVCLICYDRFLRVLLSAAERSKMF